MCGLPLAQLPMPFEAGAERLAAARARAGVSADTADVVMSPVLVASVALAGARVLLPHGCELGTAIRGTELWAKAFSQVGVIFCVCGCKKCSVTASLGGQHVLRALTAVKVIQDSLDLHCDASFGDRKSFGAQEIGAHAAARLRAGSRKQGKGGGARTPAKPRPAVELRLRLQDVAFVMQHHEMEVHICTIHRHATSFAAASLCSKQLALHPEKLGYLFSW